MLLEGNRLNQRKRIQNFSFSQQDRIGKGFSALVYKGRNQLTFALKVIELKSLKDEIAKDMLQSQISILKLISHPNSLKLHKIMKTISHCYIVTELCQNDLASVIKRKGTLPESQVLQFAAQLFQGYNDLCKNKVIHRDLKPANLLFSKGQLKIADFGFAKVIPSSQIKQKYNVGSPLYMSPEALKKNIYSQKNDIWSMGVIIFEMLYGKTPWDCRSEKQLIAKISKQAPVFPQTPKVSESTKSLIKRCLQVEPQQRASSAEILQLISQSGKSRQPSKSIAPKDDQKKTKYFTVTERFSVGNKQNRCKSNNEGTTTVVDRINVCRLLFKLSQQLGQTSVILPHLRHQLVLKINQLRKQQFSEKIKKVVDQYYFKYNNAVKGKSKYAIENLEAKAIRQLADVGQWGKQLLTAFLLLRKGKTHLMRQILDRPLNIKEGQLRRQLQLQGLC